LPPVGFKHSAFTFGHESQLHKSNLSYSDVVPPGALISLIQKGIQYLEIEAKLRNKVRECEPLLMVFFNGSKCVIQVTPLTKKKTTLVFSKNLKLILLTLFLLLRILLNHINFDHISESSSSSST